MGDQLAECRARTSVGRSAPISPSRGSRDYRRSYVGFIVATWLRDNGVRCWQGARDGGVDEKRLARHVPGRQALIRARAAVAVASLLSAVPVGAQEDADLAKAAQNPVAAMISLPLQNNTFFGVGPHGDTANVLNVPARCALQPQGLERDHAHDRAEFRVPHRTWSPGCPTSPTTRRATTARSASATSTSALSCRRPTPDP